MSRVEVIPLHLPIPELATHPRMTRAEVAILSVDLLQLSAEVRVVQIESIEKQSTPEDDATPA